MSFLGFCNQLEYIMSVGFPEIVNCKGTTFSIYSPIFLGSSGNVLYSLNKSLTIETFHIYSSWKKTSRKLLRFCIFAHWKYLHSTQLELFSCCFLH